MKLKVDFLIEVPETLIDLPILEESIIDYLHTWKLNEGCIEVVITTPDKLKELNTNHRNKPTSTDVLSFPIWKSASEVKGLPMPNLGTVVLNELFLSKQATEKGYTITDEAIFLTHHSIDHLMGKHHPK